VPKLVDKEMNCTEEMADELYEAERSGQSIPPLSEQNPDLTVQNAYQVQLRNINKKLAEGQNITGKKIGLTSVAMQETLGVGEPDYGHLLDGMVIENGGVISFDRVMQPRVEAEIAFVLKEDIIGPKVSTLDVLQVTDYVVPALEIVDSRIQDWKITLADTVADNASSGLYVLGGKPTLVHEYDLKQTGMALYKNGKLINTGVGAAALGDPAYCVAWLANKLAEFDISLKAGEVILSGALAAMVPAQPGDFFQARFAHIGEVGVSFSEPK
jgi:2-keto-4-pentenoate hydratase